MADIKSTVMTEKDIDTVSKKQKIVKIAVQVMLYAFLTIMALIVLFPFYWMLISSVKSIAEYNQSVPSLFPQEFHFENYVKAFNTANLGTLFKNTVFVGVVSTALVFEEGKRHHCVYNTPFMPFQVCVHTLTVDNRLLTEGFVDLDYVVEIRGAQAERTKFRMELLLILKK